MKKVVVMPYTDYEKMNVNHQSTTVQQPLPTSLYEPKLEKMIAIEKELGEILNSRMNIHEKRSRYQDILQTLLDFKDKYTQDNVQAFKNEDPSQEDYLKDFRPVLETSLPPTVKNKGIALYETLKDKLTWDTSGQIVIDGQPIIGSNIVDLISDLVRTWKRDPITGWPIIKQKLRTINFPRSLISNQNRLNEIEKVFSSPRPVITPTLESRSKRTHKGPYSTAKKLRKKASIEKQWVRI